MPLLAQDQAVSQKPPFQAWLSVGFQAGAQGADTADLHPHRGTATKQCLVAS